MPVMVRGSFGDLLDPRFRKIEDEEKHKLHEDIIPYLYGMPGATTPFRDTERDSEISGLPRAGQFTGSIDYASFYQGYDTVASYMEFGQGIQIERTLLEWDQFSKIEGRPRSLIHSMYRRRQFDAYRWLRQAFNVDTFFHNRSEGVALCSNSHTTTTGVSTSAGFDNLVTSQYSETALAAMVIQAANVRDLQGEPEEVILDTIIAPIDIYEQVWESIASMGKVDVATNNRNVHYGAYTIIFMRNKVDFTDTNDWFAADSTKMKDNVLWFDQVWPGGGPETGFTEDFDTFYAKYRAYSRYTNMIKDWRPFIGAQVS